MSRTMPSEESKKLFKSLQPDVCSAMLQQMTAQERGEALSGLPQMSCTKIINLLPCPCLVGALAGACCGASRLRLGPSETLHNMLISTEFGPSSLSTYVYFSTTQA